MLWTKCRVTHWAVCWLTFGQSGPSGKHSFCTSTPSLCLFFWVTLCLLLQFAPPQVLSLSFFVHLPWLVIYPYIRAISTCSTVSFSQLHQSIIPYSILFSTPLSLFVIFHFYSPKDLCFCLCDCVPVIITTALSVYVQWCGYNKKNALWPCLYLWHVTAWLSWLCVTEQRQRETNNNRKGQERKEMRKRRPEAVVWEQRWGDAVGCKLRKGEEEAKSADTELRCFSAVLACSLEKDFSSF